MLFCKIANHLKKRLFSYLANYLNSGILAMFWPLSL
jgi:hypothetical protein